MKSNIDIDGIDELQRNFAAMAKEYGVKVAQATQEGGEMVRGTAVKSIQEKSSGKQVTRYREGGQPYSHVQSQEGDAPNTDTGRLVQSINVQIKPDGVFVGSTLKYAPALEFSLDRPWLNPALESNRSAILKRLAAAVKKID